MINISISVGDKTEKGSQWFVRMGQKLVEQGVAPTHTAAHEAAKAVADRLIAEAKRKPTT